MSRITITVFKLLGYPLVVFAGLLTVWGVGYLNVRSNLIKCVWVFDHSSLPTPDAFGTLVSGGGS